VSPAGVSSAKELEGKTVAVSRIGSESHRYGSLILESGGADPKKVTFIQTGSTTVSLTALQQGSVNAAVLSPPFTGNHGGERVQDPRPKPISAGGAPWLGLGCQSAKDRETSPSRRNMLRSMRDVWP
jgi:ABC-type amino acid transport substrate-binding protein